MVLIAPSILAADFSQLAQEVHLLQSSGADLLHVDVMDGHFVPNLTMGPMWVQTLRKLTSLPLDVHLMIEQPERWIDTYASAGANVIHVHQEACVHLHRVVQHIRQVGCNVGVALNPATPIDTLTHVLEWVDRVLIMTVNPGFSGQTFLPQIVSKIRLLKKIRDERNLHFQIQVDGGINAETAKTVCLAGADILVAGSFIFTTSDYSSRISLLRSAALPKEQS